MSDFNDRFFHLYNTQTNRLEWKDYSRSWYYYITVCTKDMIDYFWIIENWIMILNDIWKILKKEIIDTSLIRENARIDTFVIMPNHTHLIIQILSNQGVVKKYKHWWFISWSVSSIVNIIKWNVTRYCHDNLLDFKWQSRFYDHIIRNKEELNIIREYIENNPKKRLD